MTKVKVTFYEYIDVIDAVQKYGGTLVSHEEVPDPEEQWQERFIKPVSYKITRLVDLNEFAKARVENLDD